MSGNNLSIITYPLVRVMSVPHREKPPPPTIIIAAQYHSQTTEQETGQDETEVYYPGEGFEGITDLPSCMLGRVKRRKNTRTWQVITQVQIDMLGVDTTVAIDPDNPKVVRTTTRLASGTRVVSWQSVWFGPIELVPPLDHWGLIPDCGGVFQDGWGSSWVVSEEGELPTTDAIMTNLGYDPWRVEAERVRERFSWEDFNVEYGQDSQGVFPMIRVVPLTHEILTDYAFPHDCSRLYTGNSRANNDYLWVPKPPGTLVDDRPWREEVEEWRDGIDWLGVVASQSNTPRGILARDGSVSLKTEASPDDKPTWQITVTWTSNVGGPDVVYTFANMAESRLIRIDPQPDGGFKEIRELWMCSWHPESGAYRQRLIKAGSREVLMSPAYPPNWKIEAYE